MGGERYRRQTASRSTAREESRDGRKQSEEMLQGIKLTRKGRFAVEKALKATAVTRAMRAMAWDAEQRLGRDS